MGDTTAARFTVWPALVADTVVAVYRCGRGRLIRRTRRAARSAKTTLPLAVTATQAGNNTVALVARMLSPVVPELPPVPATVAIRPVAASTRRTRAPKTVPKNRLPAESTASGDMEPIAVLGASPRSPEKLAAPLPATVVTRPVEAST